MFTGITEEIGKIQSIANNSVGIKCKTILSDVKIGDSIAVNGVCLTVRELLSDGFVADISMETQNVTTFKNLCSGSCVNLERAMPANGRFGGHIVSGHIDEVGTVVSISSKSEFFEIYIKISNSQKKYVVKKGSITINGISLTIADVDDNIIKLAIIPHTFENTNLKYLKNGDNVNIETDILAKYVEKFLSTKDNKSSISLEFLQQNGF